MSDEKSESSHTYLTTCPTCLTCPSEYDSWSDLHHPGRRRRDDLAEPGIHLIASGVEAGDRADRGELRVIDVIDLPAQLQAPSAVDSPELHR